MAKTTKITPAENTAAASAAKPVSAKTVTAEKPAVKKTAAKPATVKTAPAVKKTAAKSVSAAKKTAAKPVAKPAPAATAAIENSVPAARPLTVYAGGANDKKILFAASECAPFIASGGLGDVTGSLPKALAKLGYDVRVILPLYSDIPEYYRSRFVFEGSTAVSLSWRNQYMGVFSYFEDGVRYYFIDNEYYFKRAGLYGQYDDGERFAFFSKSVIDACKLLGFIPKVIHCNDWQTALVPAYLKTVYAADAAVNTVRTAFSIHNIEYQGKFGFSILENILGIPAKYAPLLSYDGNINLLKGAVQCCDKLSTVSPTYAREITTPFFSHGLHFIIRENEYKLSGILNGIDYAYYNPFADKALFKNYGEDTPENKAANKRELQKMFNLPVDADTPLLAVISRLVPHKGMDLLRRKVHDILSGRVQMIVLGKGDLSCENALLDLQREYSEKLRAVIAYNTDLSRKIYAAADVFIMPSQSEPCGLSQMIASRYGAVPVVRETGGLADSIRDVGLPDGNGFTFKDYNADDMMNRISAALSLYDDKPKWTGLVKRVMAVDFSWEKSAKTYGALYDSLMR